MQGFVQGEQETWPGCIRFKSQDWPGFIQHPSVVHDCFHSLTPISREKRGQETSVTYENAYSIDVNSPS